MKKFIVSLLLCFGIVSGAYAGHVHKIQDGITATGDVLQIAIPASGFLYSMIIDDWQGAGQVALATGSTFATAQILKNVVNEPRPYQPQGSVGDSFPSGHTSFAFAGAAYWQIRYGWAIGAPMYAAAAFVGYSRVHGNMHYWGDVIAGAAIGTGFNYLFTTKYAPKNTTLSVAPVDGGAMLRFNTEF